MRMTDKSMSAVTLGGELAKFCFEGYASQYAEALIKLRQHLEVIDVDPALLPDNATVYREQCSPVLRAVSEQLRAERAKLGGDCYALPWFGLTYGSFIALATVAVGGDADWTTPLIADALADLGIESSAATIAPYLEREVQWIEVTGDCSDQTVAVSDVSLAYGRLLHQLLHMWREAEKRQAARMAAPRVDQSLYHPCLILATEEDTRIRHTIAKALNLQGIDIVDDPDIRTETVCVIAVLSRNSLTHEFVHRLKKLHEYHPLGERTFLVRDLPMEVIVAWQPSDASLTKFFEDLSQLLVPGVGTLAELEQTVPVLMRSLRKTVAA